MSVIDSILFGHSTAESRWARLGPYYAMFPLDFAFKIVKKYSEKDDYIIDPFAGRFSSIFAGSVIGRKGIGIEINPVGWLYGKTKLFPAPLVQVLERLDYIYKERYNFKKIAKNSPLFFKMCFCDDVLNFLLSARENLLWETSMVDTTLMSIILVYLHGKRGQSLSNQMRMTKAMGMNYSINWWRTNNMEIPPEINSYEFLKKRIEWRYKYGLPKIASETEAILGDSVEILTHLIKTSSNRFSLLFTSPPYSSVTNYYSDQWLRYWMLGGPGNPLYLKEKYKERFNDKEEYCNLLNIVFEKCSILMKKKSTIYVRTDIRQFTRDTTIDALKKHFPNHKMFIISAEIYKRTQTDLMGNTSLKKGEVDIILQS